MKKEYIEREAATQGLGEHLNYMLDGAPISQGTRDIYEMAYRHCIDKINSIPAADVREVVWVKWIDCGDGESIKCSVEWCGFIGSRFWAHNFCPNCGAQMEVDDGT